MHTLNLYFNFLSRVGKISAFSIPAFNLFFRFFLNFISIIYEDLIKDRGNTIKYKILKFELFSLI